MCKMHKSEKTKSLPLFQVNTPYSEPTMNPVTEQKVKTKRNKKLDVQVHKGQKERNDDIKIHKSFSANFDGQKYKNKKSDSFDNLEKISEDEASHKIKVKRKYLMKEIDQLSNNNEVLNQNLSKIQDNLTKKETQLSKIKNKLSSLQNFNKELLDENNILKVQYEDLLVELEKLKTEKSKCKNCYELKQIIDLSATNFENLKQQNKNLNEDINMLKNVVYRLNVQLERYQEKLRNNNLRDSPTHATQVNENVGYENCQIISESTQHNDHAHTPISWGSVNVHTLGPLLDAYQDTIKEKEDIIQKYEFELSSFTGKLKSICDENEMLHKKHIEDTELIKKTMDEYETMKTDYKNARDQNEVLIKKCALKHDKVQELCKIYDHKINSMRRDYEILQEQYHKSRAELASLNAKYQTLLESHEAVKSDRQAQIPLSVHTASVNECKKLFEELKLQYETEKNKLQHQIKQLEEQLPSLETQIVDLSTEKRELQIKAKTAEKQIKKLEQKLKDVQGNLTHSQISRDSCKRQLGKAIEFGKELINEQESLLKQLASRNKESKAAIQYGNSIATKMDSLKMQLKTVQKDAYDSLSSVEKRITEQDLSIETMKRDHEQEIASLLQELREKDKYIAKLMEENAPSQPYLLYRDRHIQLT